MLEVNSINEKELIETADTQDKWIRLLTMLNTLNLQTLYFNTKRELKNLIKDCAIENPYLTCQCIVYSRCLGKSIPVVSHIASVFIAPYISGMEYSKRFYSLWNWKEKKGGVIFEPDDMHGIMVNYININNEYETKTITNFSTGNPETIVVNNAVKLTNAMKKGFRGALESMDSYNLLKYKSKLIDIINLVHPRPSISQATVEYKGKEIYTLDAIVKDYPILVDRQFDPLNTIFLTKFNAIDHIEKVNQIQI